MRRGFSLLLTQKDRPSNELRDNNSASSTPIFVVQRGGLGSLSTHIYDSNALLAMFQTTSLVYKPSIAKRPVPSHDLLPLKVRGKCLLRASDATALTTTTTHCRKHLLAVLKTRGHPSQRQVREPTASSPSRNNTRLSPVQETRPQTSAQALDVPGPRGRRLLRTNIKHTENLI